MTSYGRRKKRSFVERHGRSFEKPAAGNELLVTQAFVVVDKFAKKKDQGPTAPTAPAAPEQPQSPAPQAPILQHQPAAGSLLYAPRPTTNDISFGQDTSRAPFGAVPGAVNERIAPTIASAEGADGAEICLNAVGIVVGLCMFLVAQLIIVFGVAHLWQRRRNKLKAQSEENLQNTFNPYSVRR